MVDTEMTTDQQKTADPVTEGGDQPGEALAPVLSWGDGSAPSLPSVGRDQSDADSAVGGMSVVSTTTASLRSSIYDHVEEDGRTYHRYKQGKYPLPNDEAEQERLDIQHAVMGITLEGRLYLAPIDPNLQHALDFATGTGIWAIEFAQQYPLAQVLGTDLSAIQPEFVPANCRFEIDDAEDEWNFSEKFDFIHGRALLSCFKDPSSVIREAFKSLAPGGYLELQDGTFPLHFVGEPPVESDLYKWSNFVSEGAIKSGRPWHNAQYYKKWMEEIGFEDVVEKRFFWPTSPWAKGRYYKAIAAYFQADLLKGVEGLSLKVLKALDWTAEEVQAFLPGVKKDLKDTSIHAYCPIYVVYGRKPKEQT